LKDKGGFMKYIKKFGLIAAAAVIFTGAAAMNTSAQRRGYGRPIIVRSYGFHGPFWGRGIWGSPFYGDPYWNDPYYWEMRERYYKEKDVRDAARNLEKDRAKYGKDGVIDAKEQEKLQKARRKYNEKVASLQKYRREY
jgi:hypothetical protein